VESLHLLPRALRLLALIRLDCDYSDPLLPYNTC
jgi:hypothetical protein